MEGITVISLTRTQCIIWFTVSMAEMKLIIWQGKYKSWAGASELKGCFCTFNAPSKEGHDQVQLRLPIPLPHPDPWPDEYDVATIPDACRVEKRGCGGAQRTLPAGLLLVN